MIVTLKSRNRNFVGNVDGESYRLRAGVPSEDLDASVARALIEQAAEYDLEVVEGEVSAEPEFDAEVFTSATAAKVLADAGIDPDDVDGSSDGRINVKDAEAAVKEAAA